MEKQNPSSESEKKSESSSKSEQEIDKSAQSYIVSVPSGSTEPITSGDAIPRHTKRKKSQPVRYWFSVKDLSNPVDTTEKLLFKIASYNILSQELLERNFHLYSACDKTVLSWEYRFRIMQEELMQLNADIFCLQEVQGDHYQQHIEPWFKHTGYQGLYKKRTGNNPDGCAIFFRVSKFSLADSRLIELKRPGIPLLDRDNVAIVVLLNPITSQQPASPICVTTTHLLFNPRRGDVKLAQLQILLAEIDLLLSLNGQKPQESAQIFCGDFNLLPFCLLHKFISRGRINYTGRAREYLSGQEEPGSAQWEHRISPAPLICPYTCPIFDQCRFFSSFLVSDYPTLEQTLSINRNANVHHIEPNDRSGKSLTIGSGSLFHRFRYSSVYNSFWKKMREVTTHHESGCCTVDYIFYSAGKRRSNPSEKLRLLARYRLFNEEESNEIGALPNQKCPSDHYPLAASFLLE